MNRILRGVAGLLAATSLLVAAQTRLVATAGPGSSAGSLIESASQGTRKRGDIYKHEVDGLIAALRDASRHGDAAAPLGGDSVLVTAKILTAMGHCHRRYHRGDGPVVRPSLDFLIRSRQADGSFGDAAATAWTADALAIMDPEGFRAEVAQAREWLDRSGATVAGFEPVVAAVLEQVRADVWPQQLGGAAVEQSTVALRGSDGVDRAAAADALLQLVACQAANRELDRAERRATAQGTDFTEAQKKAFAWLLGQQKDGVFSASFGGRSFPDPALTGFGLLALQTKPAALRTKEEQATIEAGLRWLLAKQNEDGTFGDRLPNYTTCVVVAALSRWQDPAVGPALKKAQKAILAFQNIESGGYESGDRDYGSIGYGDSQRGDLSNLHFSLESLKATGLPDDHEAFAKAIVFLQRTQNLKSVNDWSGKVPDPEQEGKMIDAVSGDDGGAAYYPGNSAAGYIVQPDGKSIARSYGSMTYALLKAYTLAGVKGDDPRIQAAVKWIQNNWDLATNPGADPALGEKVKYQGLFYYYMVLAQALAAAGIDTVEVTKSAADGDGAKASVTAIEWRKALRKQLEGMQKPDGTWVNGKNDRWMEGLELLCTCYAMVALEHCN